MEDLDKGDDHKADGWEPNDPYLAAAELAFLAMYQNPPITIDMIRDKNKKQDDKDSNGS
jgi:hypothetical protein